MTSHRHRAADPAVLVAARDEHELEAERLGLATMVGDAHKEQ